MKLGTFVGQQFLNITDAEKNHIMDSIKSALELMFTDKKVEIEFRPSDIAPSFAIRLFDGSANYRMPNGTLVCPTYIRISFTSQNGYDQAVTGPCYTWAEGFEPEYNIHSYSASIDVFGHERYYRCKNVYHNVGITQTVYNYGSELEDLDIYNSICSVFNKIKHWTPTKKLI